MAICRKCKFLELKRAARVAIGFRFRSHILRMIEPLQTENSPDIEKALGEIWNFARPISDDYPGMEGWFWNRLPSGLLAGTRRILVDRRGDEIAGIGIFKKEQAENKICTIRVAPEFVGSGIGVRLMTAGMDWLDDEKPHLTISEEKLPSFAKIFQWFGYEFADRQLGRYRLERAEMAYNGLGIPAAGTLSIDPRAG